MNKVPSTAPVTSQPWDHHHHDHLAAAASFTFEPEDEAALVLGVGLDVGDEGSHAAVEHGAVAQSHVLHLREHVHHVPHRGHLLEGTLRTRRRTVNLY